MTNHRFSRSEMLLTAGAATVAGLAGCVDRAASPFVSGLGGASAGVSPLKRGSRKVVVAKPTGSAIQAAIDSLGPSGGTVSLIATRPYLIDKTIVIAKDNVTLIGEGPRVTKLVAKSGAVLTVSGYNDEYLLLVEDASNVSVRQLTVNTINEANSPGNPRVAIGAWSCNSVDLGGITCINNLGPNGFNQGLSFNKCTKLKILNCEVSQSRTGIYVGKSTNFLINKSQVTGCEAQAPNYPGPNSAISIVSSSSGVITSCFLTDNAINQGIFVGDASDLLIGSTKVYKTLAFPTRPANKGLLIENSSGPRITVLRSQFKQNSGAGVTARSSSNVTITECTVGRNGTSKGASGVEVNDGTVKIRLENNYIFDSNNPSNPGIMAGYSSSVDRGGLVSNNTVQGFAAGVALGTNSQNFVVKDNNLSSNKACVTNDGTGNHISNNLC